MKQKNQQPTTWEGSRRGGGGGGGGREGEHERKAKVLVGIENVLHHQTYSLL